MKTRLFLLLLLVAMFMLSGCKSYYLNKYCKPKTIINDSTVVFLKQQILTAKKDSIYVIRATQAGIHIPSPCDSLGRLLPGTYTSAQGNNKTSLIITDTGITVQSNCQETISQWQSLYQNTKDSLSFFREKQQTTVVEKQLSGLEKYIADTAHFWWVGFLFLSATFIYSIYMLFKYAAKIFSFKL